MCGIVGTFPNNNKVVVNNGIKLLKHRGPDDDAVVETPGGTFGHTRLSIIDVEQGHQPMLHGEYSIVFNGEIYNYQYLRSLLSIDTETDSDTEVILHLYKLFGPDLVSLLDGMFAFAITDGSSIFMARDPLGIKPLYYAEANHTLYFASEIKALLDVSAAIKEFPPGHWWHSEYGIAQYYQVEKNSIFTPAVPAVPTKDDLGIIQENLKQAVAKRMIADPGVPVGVSLSGGLDSSIVAALAKDIKNDLNTFVVGVSGSEDLRTSQEVADYLGTRHHVYEYSFDEMLEILPKVIYHLESFDAALIRSAIPNYFLAKLASDHVKVILTGEGADELYAGYDYLESVKSPDQLQDELHVITGNLHNTNLQRADRMSMAHGLEARVPFLDKEFVDFSLSLPPEWKLRHGKRVEKALLRRAFREHLPLEIINRPKQKFSDGAGSMDMLAEYANDQITDNEFAKAKEQYTGAELRSKEEMYYFRIFQEWFGSSLKPQNIGRTRSVTKDELG